MAETYHVLDYRQLPPSKVAVLVLGLPETSRLKRRIAGVKATPEILLLASIADVLSLILWSKTKDGQKNRNRPKSIFAKLTSREEESKVETFISGEDFEQTRTRLLNNLERRGV